MRIYQGYLVRSVYEGRINYTGELARIMGGCLDKLTVSVQDKDMNRLGKPATRAVVAVIPLPLEGDELNTQELADDLAQGEIEIKGHDEEIKRRVQEAKSDAERRKAEAAARAAEYARRAKGGH